MKFLMEELARPLLDLAAHGLRLHAVLTLRELVDALEHVSPEDYPRILARFQEALKPGGVLYFTMEVPEPGEVEGAYERAKAMGLPVVLAAGVWSASGQGPEVAIKGYDTVAYFKLGKAVKGSESFTFRWHDVTWQFSTQEHRDLFAAEPARYAPQYDGYCAWAMTEARLALTDPEVWKIVDGKLYLNCSRQAFEKWSTDIPGNIKKADENWPELRTSSQIIH